MYPSTEGEFVRWLTLLGQNVAMGMIVVAVYVTLRALIDETWKKLSPIILGVLFGASAVVSMTFPVQVYGPIHLDLRTVFIMVGILFGGPIGALAATVLPLTYRIYLGGPGEIAGVVTIIGTGITGYLFQWYASRSRREPGPLINIAASLTTISVNIVLIRVVSALENRPPLPPEAEEALLLITPLATLVLGTVVSMMHPRIWRRTERLLADFVETTSELVWEFDASGRFTFASERYIDVLGLRSDEIIGKTGEELGWRPVDQATGLAHEGAITERKPFRALSFVQRTKAGEPRLISVTGRPVFTDQNRYVGYRGVASDVTEIEKWRALTARMTDSVGTVVGDDYLRTLVQTVTEVLGVHAAFIGRFDFATRSVRRTYFFAKDGFTIQRDLRFDGLPAGMVATTGKPVIMASGIQDRFPAMWELDSYEGVVAYASVPLLGTRGEVLGLLGAVDVRPWESSAYIETVLTLFAGRAAAEISRTLVEEEKGRAQQREAQDGKLEALGNLAGGIAHDFNNLLGAVLGFGQFLVEDLENQPEQRHFAERIVSVAQRGRSLVQQILTFARAASVEPSRVSLPETIAEILDLLRATLPTTTQLVVDDHADDAAVFADKAQLVQVMINLCVNGSDALASEPGTVRIAVARLDRSRPELHRLPTGQGGPSPGFVDMWREDDAIFIATGAIPPGDCISLSVTDTGAGIPDAIAGQIFEPFRTTKAVGRGTGLGLAVVHRIVREHGGAILVRSIAGQGTRFEVILGSLVPSPDAGVDLLIDLPADTTNEVGASILVVDDDVDYCEMVKTALTRLGHKVDITHDPRVALGWVRHGSHHWDVLVTDLTMPYIRGHDLVRGFKALSANTRCIICTGYSDTVNEQDAIAAGADAFMMKPIDTGQLGRLVAGLVKAERLGL